MKSEILTASLNKHIINERDLSRTLRLGTVSTQNPAELTRSGNERRMAIGLATRSPLSLQLVSVSNTDTPDNKTSHAFVPDYLL